MKVFKWLGIAALIVIAASKLALSNFNSMPQGEVPVPASQSYAFSGERWLQDSADHITLMYDLRTSSASLGLDPQVVRDNMTNAVCSSPQSQGRNVGVVISEPDGSAFLSFETRCQ